MCADKQSIQFTVPMDGLALTAVGTMLLGLASALESAGGGRTQAEESAEKAAVERYQGDECGLEELRLGAASPCGCVDDEVIYDSQAAQPQVDAAAIFGAPATPPVDLYPTAITHPSGGAAEPLQPGQRILVELDTNGLPWDRRIHASTKTKCADGSWKKARGVDSALVTTVEAELKAAMSAPRSVVDPEVAAAQIVTLPPAPTVVTPPPPVSASPAPPAPAVTPPPTPAAAGVMTFPEFLTKVTAMCTAGQTTHGTVAAACQKHGLAGIPLLASRPDLIPTIAAELGVV